MKNYFKRIEKLELVYEVDNSETVFICPKDKQEEIRLLKELDERTKNITAIIMRLYE